MTTLPSQQRKTDVGAAHSQRPFKSTINESGGRILAATP
jgi:hypothetical protein